jgi:UTP--glucose-1-phosphate uridylyltransferase
MMVEKSTPTKEIFAKPIRKAVIPVAGLGTRMLPATKVIPKEMIPLVDRPMIQYVVEEALEAGLDQIVFVTAQGKSFIEDHFDHSPELERELEAKNKEELLKSVREVSTMVEVLTVRQKKPLGLGHAILCAASVVGEEAFGVLLPDDLFVTPTGQAGGIAQTLKFAKEYSQSSIGVFEVPQKETFRYGIAAVEKDEKISAPCARVSSLVEKPKPDEAPSNLALPGRYVLNPRVFDHLRQTKPGSGGEIQLTDSLDQLAKEKELIAVTLDGKRYDSGNKLGYLKATVDFALQRDDLKKDFKEFLRSLDLS